VNELFIQTPIFLYKNMLNFAFYLSELVRHGLGAANDTLAIKDSEWPTLRNFTSK